MTIGDVNSDEKGSGARYNDGKPPMELVPLRLVANSFLESVGIAGASEQFSGDVEALCSVGRFQEGGDADDLLAAIYHLGYPWIECAEVFGYGRKKYASWNWAKGMDWSVPLGCIGRHWLKMINGEDLDSESGLSHRGHILCNIVMLLTFIDTYPEGDDRPTKWFTK